jgi:hypothetical protein
VADNPEAEPIGPFVGMIRPVSSSKFWAGQGFGRRWLLLFERGLLVLETNLPGRPLGSRRWLGAMGEAADSPVEELGRRVAELAELDSRNMLIRVEEVSAAHLITRRRWGVWALRLSLREGLQTSLFWSSPWRTYATLAADGSLEAPRRAPYALAADLRQILGPRLANADS